MTLWIVKLTGEKTDCEHKNTRILIKVFFKNQFNNTLTVVKADLVKLRVTHSYAANIIEFTF